MKTNTQLTSIKTLAALSLATLFTAAAFAEGAVRYEATPTGNKCTIAGTSTIHDWTMDSKIISGFIEADEKFPESALTDAAAAKPKATVSMPVRSFKSGKAAMDDKMQVSMDSTKFMKIEYRLIELKPKSKAGATGTSANLHGRKRDLVFIRATTTSLLVTLLRLLDNLL